VQKSREVGIDLDDMTYLPRFVAYCCFDSSIGGKVCVVNGYVEFAASFD
jgi:hypothetical protein